MRRRIMIAVCSLLGSRCAVSVRRPTAQESLDEASKLIPRDKYSSEQWSER